MVAGVEVSLKRTRHRITINIESSPDRGDRILPWVHSIHTYITGHQGISWFSTAVIVMRITSPRIGNGPDGCIGKSNAMRFPRSWWEPRMTGVISHGFRRDRSVKTGAQAHVGKQVVIHMDLRDFFPSVHFGRVRGLFIAYGYSFPVASTLAALLTEAERQPVKVADEIFHVPVSSRYCIQGAPTSPAICNAILLRLDRRLAGLARSLALDYTRYADDLTFSGDDPDVCGRLLTRASRIVEDEGFAVNTDKTRVMREGQQQRVTGVTVNETLGLSRKERRRIRAALHRLKFHPNAEKQAQVEGMLAYLQMLNPEQARALRNQGPPIDQEL